MTDPEASAAWLEAWIERQREQLARLRETSMSAPGAEQTHDVAARWFEIGQACLQGLAQFSQTHEANAQCAAAASSQSGADLLGAWRRAWAGAESASRDANQRFSDLLAQLPALGLAREHTLAWRELGEAQREYQAHEQALRAELVRVQSAALELLEARIRERQAAKRPLTGWRETYDLWVECAEHVFSEVAHSDAYGKLQAELGNAVVRLRARQQAMVEQALRQFDLPTRSELNTLHRQMRQMRERLAELETQLAHARGSGL